MKRRRTIRLVSLPGLVLAAMLYVAVNMLASIWAPTHRLDVTQHGLFTLADGTKKTLDSIDEALELHFFFSTRLGREVPAYASYARRVRTLVREIATASRGKVLLVEHDPEPFSDAEDLAVEFGLQGVPVDDGDEMTWFGLAGRNAVDEVEKIEFFQPQRERLLEYDLTRLLYILANPEPVVVGVISGLPIMGDMSAQQRGAQASVLVPWTIGSRLRSEYEVINLPTSFDRLPRRISTMLVVNPQQLSVRALYELEQFLFRGGSAVFFLDPLPESTPSPSTSDDKLSDWPVMRLLEHWGVELTTDRVVGDRTMALKVNAGTAARPVPAEYLAWLGVTAQFMDQQDPIVSQLPNLHFASAGSVRLGQESGLTLQSLVTSSDNSSLIDIENVRGNDPDVLQLLETFKPDDKTYVLAARLEGNVSTYFEDGPPVRTVPPAKDEKDDNPEPQLTDPVQPINVVVVTDTDLLRDRFWLQKQDFFGRSVEQEIAGNGDFFMNIISNLSGSNELSKLRTRGVSQRPFERVDQLRQRARRISQNKESTLQEKLRETQSRIDELQGVKTVKRLNVRKC